jgi:hypothetical protein
MFVASLKSPDFVLSLFADNFLRAAFLSFLFLASVSSRARFASSDNRGIVAVFVFAHSGTTYFLRPSLGRTGEEADTVCLLRGENRFEGDAGTSGRPRAGDVHGSSGVL